MKQTKRMQEKRLMIKYHDAIKEGNFAAAHIILHLLNRKKVVLGFSDAEYYVETTAEKLGLTISYERKYYWAKIHL